MDIYKRSFGRNAVIFSAVVLASLPAAAALAAPLNYSTSTYISLASPSTTLTIASGSTADTVVTGSGNVIITMSAGSSSAFTLSSPQDLAVSADNSGGSWTSSCNSGVTQLTISEASGSTVYTVTPTGNACVPASGAVVMAGGGLDPRSLNNAPPASSAFTGTTPTTQERIKALEVLIQELTLKLQTVRASMDVAPAATVFGRDLSYGMIGNDAKALQLFLVEQNSGPKARLLAAVPKTRRFGPSTRAALIEFQKKNGIYPANGNFGPKTRAYIRSLLNR